MKTMTGSLVKSINDILEEDGLRPDQVAGRVAAAMAVYNRELIGEFKTEIDSLRNLIEGNRRVLRDLAAVTKDSEVNQKTLPNIERDVHQIKIYNKRHPSLLWLLRFKTKQTISVLLVVVFLLVILAGSDLFGVVAGLFGL